MKDFLEMLGGVSEKEKIKVRLDLDLTQVALSPQEGFLLSRVDSASNIAEIFQTSPFPREETDRMLCAFLQQDIIHLAEATPSSPKSKNAPGQNSRPEASQTASQSKPSERKPKFETDKLSVEFCIEIEDFFERIQKDDLEPLRILGFKGSATKRRIKTAYIELTKKFHPDRLFRKESGPYLEMVNTIFRKVNDAYQELQKPKPKAQAAQAVVAHHVKMKNEQKERAQSLLEAAKSEKSQDPVAALNSVKLALSFDPNLAEAKELKTWLEKRVEFRKSIQVFEKGKHYEEVMAYELALEHFEKAIQLDPENIDFKSYLADFLVQKMGKAQKAMQVAHEMLQDPSTQVEGRLLLGNIHKSMGQLAKAKAEYEEVLQLDNSNLFAKKELDHLSKK